MDITGQEERFRRMFAEEAEGRLTTLSELLLALETTTGDPELLAAVFREAYTLKGAAAVVGFADVLQVAHALEEVLEGLRRGDRGATPALVDGLLGAVDGMREMLPAVLGGGDRAEQAERLVASLQAAPAEPAPSGSPPSGFPPSGFPPAAAGAGIRGAGETIRLPVERLDELVRLVGEAAAASLRLPGRRPPRPGPGRRPRAARAVPGPGGPATTHPAGPHGPVRHHRRAAAAGQPRPGPHPRQDGRAGAARPGDRARPGGARAGRQPPAPPGSQRDRPWHRAAGRAGAARQAAGRIDQGACPAARL